MLMKTKSNRKRNYVIRNANKSIINIYKYIHITYHVDKKYRNNILKNV